MYRTPSAEATASFPLAEYSENDLNSAFGGVSHACAKARPHIVPALWAQPQSWRQNRVFSCNHN
jgi:hypothetical protein